MNALSTYIEHTVLKPTATEADIDKCVAEALAHQFVGVCVPPYWVKKVAREVQQSGIRVVTVVGFPLGYQLSQVKALETQLALEHGAHEVDMVLNVSAFKSGVGQWAKAEIAQLAKLCHEGEALLKVILETAYLTDAEIVAACQICQDAGADFVKTSTGFAPAGATVPHVQLMRQTVGQAMGVKASGGIKSLADAQAMIAAGADRLGTSSGVAIVHEWLAQSAK